MIAVVALGFSNRETHVRGIGPGVVSLFFFFPPLQIPPAKDPATRKWVRANLNGRQAGPKAGRQGPCFLYEVLGWLGTTSNDALNEIWIARPISIGHSTPWLS